MCVLSLQYVRHCSCVASICADDSEHAVIADLRIFFLTRRRSVAMEINGAPRLMIVSDLDNTMVVSFFILAFCCLVLSSDTVQ